MGKLPDYIGVSAFGIKMGVIVPGSNVKDLVMASLEQCNKDGILDDGDTICITESIVARAQNNYVTVNDIALQVREKLQIQKDSRLGVLFPLLSRNRFSLVLKGIASAVPEGEVIIQLSHPDDEVGNKLLPLDFAESLGKGDKDCITTEELGEKRFKHPITEIDYIALYEEVVQSAGARVKIIICNDPTFLKDSDLDGMIVSNIHTRERTLKKVKEAGIKAITLQDICSDANNAAWSEYGLLGSNMSSGDRLKLAPRNANELADEVQAEAAKKFAKKIEVIINGDGAYCDPSTRIYELADPQPAFGMTEGLRGKYREGLKYKYLVDEMHAEGIDIDVIASNLEEKKKGNYKQGSIATEGTTPRRAEDLIASLADLISGSADAGTPLVIVKSFFK